MEELTRSEAREFFRPNFWPNTPDILHADLQSGRRSAFVARVVLAATLSANYGLYGPAYELLEHRPVRAGSEEYLDSEKYQIRAWDLERADSLAPVIARLNRIRRENPALHRNTGLRFHACDNPHILCYSKQNAAGDNTILVCVNMDYATTQAGRVEFSPAAVGRPEGLPFVLRDLLADVSYTWHDYWNYIELNPERSPVHVLRIEH
jgi:starch synthase (maltosyl-transferring)